MVGLVFVGPACTATPPGVAVLTLFTRFLQLKRCFEGLQFDLQPNKQQPPVRAWASSRYKDIVLPLYFRACDVFTKSSKRTDQVRSFGGV